MNTDTMKQVYLLAQEHCGLKIGDWVKVIRGAGSYEAGWPCGWNKYQTNHIGDMGLIINITKWGCAISFNNDNSGLLFPFFILEKVEKPKHGFKPFDKVLVRDSEDGMWQPDIFMRMTPVPCNAPYACFRNSWFFCIPYDGNEHLVGTTDMPEE